MNSATFSPNAHPWTLGKGRPKGPVEVPPIGSGPVQGWIWYDMVFHGCQWAFEIMPHISKMNVVHLFQPHHLGADFPSLTSDGIARASTTELSFMICSVQHKYARRVIASR